MLQNLLHEFSNITIKDIIDFALVAFLLYEVYKLIKGTNAVRIFIGIASIFILWKIFNRLQFKLMSDLLGQFINVGVILLVVVFQPEIRRFLLLLGTRGFIETKSRRFLFWKVNVAKQKALSIDPIVKACQKMSSTLTGALIIISKENELDSVISTGDSINSEISAPLLETIFFKNTPLHDGAVIISGNCIRAARCILPVSSNRNIPNSMGLRHRSGIGITEQTDAIAVIVSEQTGSISFVKNGQITADITPTQLKDFLDEEFNK